MIKLAPLAFSLALFLAGCSHGETPGVASALIAAEPLQQPLGNPVTPAIIRASAQEHAEKAANFTERSTDGMDPMTARARALIHQYVAVVEGFDQSPKTIESLFTPEFLINFSSGPIDTLTGFEAWLRGPAASVAAARHVLHDVTTTPLDARRLAVEMIMTWDGLTKEGGRMTAKTQHDWILAEIGDTLRIERIDVTILEPFAAAEWETG